MLVATLHISFRIFNCIYTRIYPYLESNLFQNILKLKNNRNHITTIIIIFFIFVLSSNQGHR